MESIKTESDMDQSGSGVPYRRPTAYKVNAGDSPKDTRISLIQDGVEFEDSRKPIPMKLDLKDGKLTGMIINTQSPTNSHNSSRLLLHISEKSLKSTQRSRSSKGPNAMPAFTQVFLLQSRTNDALSVDRETLTSKESEQPIGISEVAFFLDLVSSTVTILHQTTSNEVIISTKDDKVYML